MQEEVCARLHRQSKYRHAGAPRRDDAPPTFGADECQRPEVRLEILRCRRLWQLVVGGAGSAGERGPIADLARACSTYM